MRYKFTFRIFILSLYTICFSLITNVYAASVPIFFNNSIVGQQNTPSYWDVKTKDIIMQKMDYSCGSAALATILTYYLDKPTTETNIIQYLLTYGDLQDIIKRQGFSLLDLKHYAEHVGFVAQGFRMDINDLLKIHDAVLLPIVINGYRHFVVYVGNKDGRVFLLDPTFGATVLSIPVFKKMWYEYENVGLIITKNGYHENSHNILSVKKEREIFVSNSLVKNIINQTIPFFIKNPLSW